MKQNEKSSLVYFNEWLDSFLNFEKMPKKNIFWLETMKYLCDRFNNPQNSYKSYHMCHPHFPPCYIPKLHISLAFVGVDPHA